ncbi:MAG: thioredoxin domain-containing protein [Acidobacteria bacterium]|nr:thioredoxin domain-containing protein [Acidobacteriota bacterium]
MLNFILRFLPARLKNFFGEKTLVSDHKFTNRLINETSPYLLQHAHNPVDWYPWCREAFEEAEKQDKPILLSIGYSACHWCHVMERESFENPNIAKLMNDNFICVKVDREERPDLDHIYMSAVQLMTRHGGWPMTVFLFPDGRPFFGGTYFPPQDRYNMPGFPKVLTAITNAYQNPSERSRLDQAGTEVLEEIGSMNNFIPVDSPLSTDILRKAYHNLATNFDSRNGGFSHAPKFPQPMNLSFLLKTFARTKDHKALEMVELTLDKMARGGIYDHLAGGFARYSTDEKWLVPHFEKMLYDNALLSQVYLEAYQATGNKYYKQVTEEILDWVVAEMTDPKGGFYSTLDADSEGEEGKFYVWDQEEIEKLLGSEAKPFIEFYGVTKHGNFEERNILNIDFPISEMEDRVSKLCEISIEELRKNLANSRKKLREVRAKRVWPGLDDKILTAWTGMMIKSFAQAAQALKRDDYKQVAIKATEFILTYNSSNGRLLRSYKNEQARFNAYQEDYAYFIDALIATYEATFQTKWLVEARRLADIMINQFWDEEEGGFFFTSNDHEELIIRSKEYTDNATPSGNSVAVDVLLKLHHIFNDERYEKIAVRILGLVGKALERFPGGFGHMLGALDFYLGQTKEIAIIGNPESDDTKALVKTIYQGHLPNKIVLVVHPSDSESINLLPLLANRLMIDGMATAYVCEHFTCKEPVTKVDELTKQLV